VLQRHRLLLRLAERVRERTTRSRADVHVLTDAVEVFLADGKPGDLCVDIVWDAGRPLGKGLFVDSEVLDVGEVFVYGFEEELVMSWAPDQGLWETDVLDPRFVVALYIRENLRVVVSSDWPRALWI